MTSPLPRVRSTNWAIRAWITLCLTLIFKMRAGFHQLLTWNQWWVKDSNLRKLLLSDLQSDPVGHLGNSPFRTVVSSLVSLNFFKDAKKPATEPTIGLEPMTCRLQGGRSANWAMSAQWLTPFAHIIIAVVPFLSSYFFIFMTWTSFSRSESLLQANIILQWFFHLSQIWQPIVICCRIVRYR